MKKLIIIVFYSLALFACKDKKVINKVDSALTQIDLNRDSIINTLSHKDLFKKHYKPFFKEFKNYRFLNSEEKKTIFKDSIKYWDEYLKITKVRRQNDSVISWNNFQKQKDSLKNVIYPIDKNLPIGAKTLIEHKFPGDFKFNLNDTIVDKHQEELYRALKYYTDSFERPPFFEEEYANQIIINSIRYINFDDDNEYQETEYETTKRFYFNYRFSNIGTYEVYYNYVEPDNSTCKHSIENTPIKNFNLKDFNCLSFGDLVFYNRKTGDAINLSNVFISNSRFFYASKDNSIKIYSLESYYEDGESFGKFNKKIINNSFRKSHEIKIEDNGNVIINKLCTKNNIANNINPDEELKVLMEKAWGNYILADKAVRDSIINSKKLLIEKYPLGSKILKEDEIFHEGLKNNLINKAKLDSVIGYYKNLTNPLSSEVDLRPLPFIKKFNRINLGPIEEWEQIFDDNFLASNCGAQIANDEAFLHFDYRLPSINKYQVYYVTLENSKSVLILYDEITHTANVINIKNVTYNRNKINFRFFYINSKNQIEIYQGYNNQKKDSFSQQKTKEEYYKLEKTHTILIVNSSEIKINKE